MPDDHGLDWTAMQAVALPGPEPPSAQAPDFYKLLLDSLYDGVYLVDRERRITYWNKAAERLTGYPPEQVLGRCCSDNLLMHMDTAGTLLCTSSCPLAHTMMDGAGREAEVYVHHRLGYRMPISVRVGPIRNAAGEIIGAVEIFNDNTSKKAAEEKAEQLQQMAFLDALTRIGNRRYLDEKLEQHLRELAVHGSPFGILLFDLDKFKNMNDTYGHNAGDLVLASTAKTLTGSLRTSDVLGRWGGEEYLAITPGVDREDLFELGQRCRALVERSVIPFADKLLNVTISIGATLVEPGDSSTSIVERADRMLYASKRGGRNQVTIHLSSTGCPSPQK